MLFLFRFLFMFIKKMPSLRWDNCEHSYVKQMEITNPTFFQSWMELAVISGVPLALMRLPWVSILHLLVRLSHRSSFYRSVKTGFNYSDTIAAARFLPGSFDRIIIFTSAQLNPNSYCTCYCSDLHACSWSYEPTKQVTNIADTYVGTYVPVLSKKKKFHYSYTIFPKLRGLIMKRHY